VCEQPVARVPGAAPAAALEAVAERAGAARSGMEAARAALVTRREELAAAAGESRQARARAEAAAQEKQAASNALDEAQARLLGAIGDDLPARGKRPLDERLRESLEQLAVARGEHEAGAALLERARHEDESARQALAGAGEAAAAQARALEEQAQAAQQAAQEARELRTRIEAVTRGVDPAAERTRLERERTRLGESQQAAQRRERDAAEGLLQARLQREQAQRAMTDAQRALGEATGALYEGLSAAGFKNAAAAQAAVLPEPQRRELQQLADDFRSETHAAKARLQELERELQDGRASAEEVQAAEEEFVGARQRLEDASNEAARLSERLLDLERRAERARQLSEALQRERRRQALQQQLATDLRSENFRAFVLEEAFHELVAGASERLMSLSGRYAFAFEDDAFLVLDHDNAGERRSAETLSGGETFLASLALALELSQQIQRAAGAVSLESLFIDEGFGTLDPETLETITGALEDLPVGGRMVAISPPLPELTERIPNRVRVVKRPEGSRFTIETA
jgi:exonuclease SbcC